MRIQVWFVALLAGCLIAANLAIDTGGARAAGSTADQAVAYQINVAHSGALSGDALAPPLVKQWSRTDLGGIVSYPLIAGGKVFVTVQGPNGSNSFPPKWVDALDENTGATVWSHPISGTYGFVNAAYDNGTVFVLNYDGLLQSFDAGTGTAGWSVHLPGQYSFTSPPTAAGGVVFVAGGGSGGTLYAVDESNGAVLWRQGLNVADHSSPTVSSSNVYIADVCNVYAFGPSTVPGTAPEALLWRKNYQCTGGGGKTTVLGSNGLYARNEGLSNTNDILDPATGNVLGHFTAGPAPAFSGTTGFFTSSGTLRAVDGNGNTLWSFAGDGGLDTAPIVVNGDVYVGSSSGAIYAVDTGTGQPVWSTNVGAGIAAPDEQNAVLTTGLGAGEGHLIVPSSSQVTAFVAGPPDTTAPVISASVTGQAGANGWFTGPATVSWNVSDPESGISASTGCGSTTLSADTSGTTLTCSATDGQGLTSSSSVTVKIDSTPPAAACSSPATGWSASDLSVTCTAGDKGSGLANPADSSFSLSTSVPAGTETSVASTPSHQICDVAGNCITRGPYTGLKVDKKAPLITLSAPAGGTYTLNAAVAAAYSCSDGGSGLAGCAGPVASGAAIDTASVGSKTFTVNATDAVGNAAAPVTSAYTVTYGVCQPSVPTIRSGRTGSVSVQLCDAKSANVSTPSVSLTATGIYTSAGVLVKALSNTFAFTSSLNRSGGGYTETVDATGLGTGSYYVGFRAAGDPVSHQAAFAVR